MRVFLVTASDADRPVVQRLLGSVDIGVVTVDQLPAGPSRAHGLAQLLESCSVAIAVPFGPDMGTVTRVVGAAGRLGKPVIVLIPAGADPDRLPFSLRVEHVLRLDDDPDDVAKRLFDLVEGHVLLAALGGPRPGPRALRLELQAEPKPLLPTVLTATGVLTGDATRLANRTEPPPEFVADYDAWQFPDGVINNSGELRFTVDDLVHALFVTGRAPGDRMRYGSASIWEWLHRTSMVPAYVRRHYSGRLVRSRLAMELDRSELVGFSYALGQAVTAVFCRIELAVTHLMHVDRYANHYGLTFGNTRKRADLFGRAPAGWVVAEAKGRSRAMETALMNKLAAQKRSIATIGGVRPWLALGCVASFPTDRGGMRVDAVDPVEDSPETIVITGGVDAYMLAYYGPFILAIDGGEPADGGDDNIVAARFPSFGVTVRMWSDLYVRVQQAFGGLLDGLYDDLQQMLDEASSRPLRLMSDGTAMRTDWTDLIDASDWEF
ncbi:hypothetical protein AB0M46_13750 [Dactylosporangium sp. NPDC051485]|uniref:hypothetical protein n=1 Tax=Dactylosporangium sp. NPDC051485 TaxID=3154846 RepID=UPI003449A533